MSGPLVTSMRTSCSSDSALGPPGQDRGQLLQVVEVALDCPPPGEPVAVPPDPQGGRPTRATIATGPSRCFHRRYTILRTIGRGVRRGERCGRLERSAIPAAPSARERSDHLFAVMRATW